MSDTPLAEKLKRIIRLSGPLGLADYIHACMADPEFGYYQNEEAIGSKGDFVTAPEVSQMFGELIGIWCLDIWQQLGEPRRFSLVELGPGRGTLMSDILRATKLKPGFTQAVQVTLVETSPLMRREQASLLKNSIITPQWLNDTTNLPDHPVIFIANEFFDVLPVRQYVKRGSKWLERGIGIDENGALSSILMPGVIDENLLPEGADRQKDGSVFEYAPAREAIAETLATYVENNSGAALVIDYGHLKSGFGDTFQAMRNHAFADPLVAPGKSDLTSHVDFERLEQSARSYNSLNVQAATQGEFLLAMGLLERAAQLGANASPEKKEAIRNDVERLAAPGQMGNLFKVMAFSSESIIPKGF